MSRIEELPDDYDESSVASQPHPEPVKESISDPTSAPSGASAPKAKAQTSSEDVMSNGSTSKTPSLPPEMAAAQGRSTEDMLSNMNRVPLFMTTLDETDGAGGENVDLEALKALAYEGSPNEVAKNFKEQGNERYKVKIWTDAVEFYTKGLAVLEKSREPVQPDEQEEREGRWLEEQGRTQTPAEKEQEGKEAAEIAETLLVNRAACNLELQNYRRAVQDSTKALTLNPTNVKAHYRLATAHLRLSALPAATGAVTTALSHHPKNSSLLTLQSRIAEKQATTDKKQEEVSQREQRAKLEARALAVAVKARGYRTRVTPNPPDLEDALPHLERPADPTSTLILPALFLYPLASQSDMIKAMPETDSPQVHLTYLLPAPWDTKGEYTVAEVECYMETASGGLAKVGKKVAVRKVLAEGNVEVLDGLVRILVVPKERSKDWIDDFKKMRIRS